METEIRAASAERVNVKSDEVAELAIVVEGALMRMTEAISVTGRADEMIGVADSASQGVTGQRDLAARAILRPGDILETVPGLVATQHSGGGKANQYFVRGFNLDHGTDFRVTLDGVPANMPSHGHGQGYLDLNFLIPELVEKVSYRKGPYFAEEGDFSAAGAARFTYFDRLDEAIVNLSGGNFGYARALAAGSRRVGGGDLLAAVDFSHDDGPWELPDDFEKLSALVRYTHRTTNGGWRLSVQGYDARGATITVDPTTGGPVDAVDPLVRAWGFDLGVRTQAARGLHTALTFFHLDLDSELLFIGDGGATEASRPSRRLGVEWSNFYQPLDGLKLDFDAAFTRARFNDDDPRDRIPGAMEKVIAAGATLDAWRGWSLSLRWRYFGAKPLIEDDSVRSDSSSFATARVAYGLSSGVKLGLDLFNLFDSEANDIAYFYVSRLPGEAAGVEDVHFHPLRSRSLRLFLDWRF